MFALCLLFRSSTVHNVDDVMRHVCQGLRRRAEVSTLVHEHSSRSHLIVTMSLLTPSASTQHKSPLSHSYHTHAGGADRFLWLKPSEERESRETTKVCVCWSLSFADCLRKMSTLLVCDQTRSSLREQEKLPKKCYGSVSFFCFFFLLYGG